MRIFLTLLILLSFLGPSRLSADVEHRSVEDWLLLRSEPGTYEGHPGEGFELSVQAVSRFGRPLEFQWVRKSDDRRWEGTELTFFNPRTEDSDLYEIVVSDGVYFARLGPYRVRIQEELREESVLR